MSLPDLPRFYIPNPLDEKQLVLSMDDARHAKVLQLADGDEVHIVDGFGKLYQGVIHAKKRDFIITNCHLIHEANAETELILAVAPTKNINRFEWVIEKAVELGVTQIIPLKCENSERQHIKSDRLNKIAQSAMRQSKGLWLPQIHEFTPFKDLGKFNATHRWIAHCRRGEMAGLDSVTYAEGSRLIAIGPEGDFSQSEIEEAIKNDYQALSLGSRRLRTETAAITVCIAANLLGE